MEAALRLALLVEFEPASYERSFRIAPELVERDAITAQYQDGVLKLVLPKSRAMRSKKIDVK